MADSESIEVPEADALEQRVEVGIDEDVQDPPPLDPEVPEADALEQARTVPIDDGYEHQ